MAPLAVAAFIGTRDAARRDAAASRAERADHAAAGLQATLVRVGADVHSLAGIFATAREVDAFAQYAAPGRTSPGLVALAWAPRVTPAMRSAFEQQSGFPIAQVGADGFAVPAPRDSETFPILYVTPGERNTPLVGIDIAGQAAVRDALRRVLTSGAEQSTSPVKLPQGVPGIVLVEGAYQRGAATSTPAERRAALNGYTVGMYRLDQIGAAAFADLAESEISVHDGVVSAFARGDATGGTARTVTFAGRDWTVVVRSDAGVATSLLPWVVLAGALLIALLVAAMFEGASRRLAFSERLVDLRTVELREALAQLTVTNQQLDEARAAAEEASRIDPLTGVYNRSHLVDLVRVELNRAARGGTTPGILLVEVDGYHALELSHSEAAVEAVLVEVSARLATVLRSYDALARWSTAEFGVLAPNAPTDETLLGVAEAMRHVVGSAPIIVDGAEQWVTVTVGATRATGEVPTFEVFAVADGALAAARAAGPDRSQVADAVLPPRPPDAMRIVSAYSAAVAVREGTPEGHTAEVARLAAEIAQELTGDDDVVERARLAGLLHDIGKVALPAALLAKIGPLDETEWELMHRHPAIGEEIARRLPDLAQAGPAIRHHHERHDGTGYPDGLAGAEIPAEARAVAIADAYCAMTAGSAWRLPYDTEAALAELRAGAGSQFDPAAVDALERATTANHAA